MIVKISFVSLLFFFTVFLNCKIESAELETFILSHPLNNSSRILSDIWPLPEKIVEPSDTIHFIATPGEYEPGSFILRAKQDIKGLKFTTTDLKAENGKIISSSNIDIKVVKVWYQSGSEETPANFAINQGKRVLVPELLLNDDSLVKADYQTQDNYLKLNYPEGEKYICISREDAPFAKRDIWDDKDWEEFPVKDAPTILPVNIEKGTNKQFWVTIHIPEDTPSGIYIGKIGISTYKEEMGNIVLKLRVLPFKLEKPYYCSGIFFGGLISLDERRIERYKASLRNLIAHGVTSPQLAAEHSTEYLAKYGETLPWELLEEALKIRAELGMNKYPIYLRSFLPKPMAYEVNGISGNSFDIGNPSSKEELQLLKETVRKVIAMAKKYGFPEVYFYGMDESPEVILKSQRPAWEAVHQAGGKVYVAADQGNPFENVGDILDMVILQHAPSKETAEKWHSLNKKVTSYANPQSGREEPETYRRNYGLLLKVNDYDGGFTWHYYAAGYGNLWNDFDTPVGNIRNEVFVYPTIDGVIDTLAWEGYREGVDDARYYSTLGKKIDEDKKNQNKEKKRIALEAEKYLESLDIKRDLDNIRTEIINYLLKLN